MIKTIVNKFIKAALDELFLNSPSVQLSMGSDMFSDSRINLSNLTFRPDIFDVMMQPLSLVAGHLGSLNVEGIAELALGGQLKFSAEDIFLLFVVDPNADPERVQTMKKILVELQGANFSPALLFDLLKRVQGVSVPPDGNLQAKRKTLYKVFDYLSKGFFFTIKNIHIRIEHKAINSDNLCHSLGLVIPLVKISPAPAAMRPADISANNPVLLNTIRSILIYADYHSNSYRAERHDLIIERFRKHSASEKHLLLCGLTDIELLLALIIKRSSGAVCPQLRVKLSQFKLALDKVQLQVIDELLSTLTCAKKRCDQAVRVQKIFRSGFPLPRVSEVTSIRLLPHLMIRGATYPNQASIPGANQVGLVAFMKERVGSRWPVMLWKHLIRLVLHDLRKSRPYGRWKELIWLVKARREYAFLYSRLLKRVNPSTGEVVYNPEAQLPSTKLRDLFEYEMLLPVQTITLFRTLAQMIVMIGYFKKMNLNGQNHGQSRGKTNIVWRDLLKIHAQLLEAKREAAPYAFDRRRTKEDDDHDSITDANSVASDEGSVSSLAKRDERTPTKSEANGALNRPSSTSSLRKGFFSGVGFGSNHKNDSDSKLTSFGKLDFSGFGDTFTRFLEKDERTKETSIGDDGVSATDDIESLQKHPSLLDSSTIADAVQWVLLRHQEALSFRPPDVNFQLKTFKGELKWPLLPNKLERDTICAVETEDISASVNISQSTTTTATTASNLIPSESNHQSQSLRGFASLSGALIQVRLTVKRFSLSFQVVNGSFPSKGNIVDEDVFKKETNGTPEEVPTDQQSTRSSTHLTRPSFQLLPGKTVLESLQSYQEQEAQYTVLLQETEKPLKEKHVSNPIEKAFPSMVYLHGASSTSQGQVMKHIAISEASDNFFIFCLILDLDEKGEGAGDFQVQLGGLLLDLDSISLESLVKPEYSAYLSEMSQAFSDLQQVLLVQTDPSLLVDWANRLLVIPALFNTNNTSPAETKAAKELAHIEALEPLEETAVTSSEFTPENVQSFRRNRKAEMFNRNFVYWISFFEKYLPRVLSVCFRSCPVVIQSLESSLIRQLVLAKFQSMIDSAVHRHQDGLFEDTLTIFTLLNRILKNDKEKLEGGIRKWGTKQKLVAKRLNSSRKEGNESAIVGLKVKALVPGVEVLLAKVSNPYPAIELNIQGICVLKVPMTDETLCHYLAWILAELMPMV